MVNKYYQQELHKLRELAKEFSDLNPAVAPLLSGSSADPDVERLLEGVAFLSGMGFQPSNIDVVVITEAPKIGPVSEAMTRRLSQELGIPEGAVSVKGKTNEGMGWIGAGEGLAVHAVALVVETGSGVS